MESYLWATMWATAQAHKKERLLLSSNKCKKNNQKNIKTDDVWGLFLGAIILRRSLVPWLFLWHCVAVAGGTDVKILKGLGGLALPANWCLSISEAPCASSLTLSEPLSLEWSGLMCQAFMDAMACPFGVTKWQVADQDTMTEGSRWGTGSQRLKTGSKMSHVCRD